MVDIIELAADPCNHEPLWDYCLEHNIIIPAAQPVPWFYLSRMSKCNTIYGTEYGSVIHVGYVSVPSRASTSSRQRSSFSGCLNSSRVHRFGIFDDYYSSIKYVQEKIISALGLPYEFLGLGDY